MLDREVVGDEVGTIQPLSALLGAAPLDVQAAFAVPGHLEGIVWCPWWDDALCGELRPVGIFKAIEVAHRRMLGGDGMSEKGGKPAFGRIGSREEGRCRGRTTE
jgi:hypothetical protein